MSENYPREILYSRMIGIVDAHDLEVLGKATVAIPGCGGVGYTHAEALARMGIGHFKIADFDTFGPENVNRQFGATTETFGRPKAQVLHDRLISINPEITVDVFPGVNEDTVSEFLDKVTFVCDALDYFVIKPRRLMYGLAYARNIPVVMSGPIGFGAATHLFIPGGMTFDEFFDLSDEISEEQMLVNFGAGLNPGRLDRHYLADAKLDFVEKKVASVSSSCLLATVQSTSTAVLKILGKESAVRPAPWVQQMDYVAGKFHQVLVRDGVRSIRQNPEEFFG